MSLFFYLFMSVVLLYLCVYYGSLPLVFLFLAQVLIPLVFLIPALIAGCRTVASLRTRSQLWEEDGLLWLEAPRGGFFPLPHITAAVRVRCVLTGESRLERVGLLPCTGKVGRVQIPFSPQGCGLYRVSLAYCRGRDYLRIFPLHIPQKKEELELFVMPAVYDVRVEVTPYTRAFATDGEEYHKEKSGGDYSEIFGVRPYQPGDKMSRVHWKLTAKTGEYMMREGSLPLGNSVALFVDTRFLSSQLWDTVFSLSCGMIDSACRHYLCWLTEEGQVRRAVIAGREDLYGLVPQLFQLGLQQTDIEQQYRRAYPGEKYAASLRVSQGVYLNGKLLPGSQSPESFFSGTVITL